MLCPACTSENEDVALACRSCGAPLPSAGSSRRVRIGVDGERKQVTILFADITGSTRLIADLDPELAARRLEPMLRAMIAAVHRFEGTVNRVQGDGIMALFGAPVAYEDHAVRACRAAIEMHKAMQTGAEGGAAIRVGLHSGEVVVRSVRNDVSIDYDAVGASVHLAARMEQLAEPGATYMTPETFRLAADWIEAEPVGPLEVKGLPRPLQVYRLLGEAPGRTRWEARRARGIVPLVGREAELAALEAAADAAQEGRGGLIALSGEPGVGKSRLAHEFANRKAASGWTRLTAAAAPHGAAGIYEPIGALLRAWAGVGERDDAEAAARKLRNVFGSDSDALQAPLRNLLGLPVEETAWRELDPPVRRQRVLAAVRAFLVRAAAAGPLLVMVEDLHWADSGTVAALDAAAETAADRPILLLVTYRPEFRHEWPAGAQSREILLEALEPESAMRMLDLLLGEHPELREVKTLIAERAEGTPLFLEEMARALVETGALAGEPGVLRAARPIDAVEIPATVQSVLAARIDRLPVEEKNLLQLASVLGNDVPAELLRRLAGLPDPEIERLLARLQAGGFLFPAPSADGALYSFKHALTHEVAYRGLLRERRRALHVRALEALEASQAAPEQIERLAFHAAGGEVWDKAVQYLRQAGARAIEQSAYREAIRFLEQALEALGQSPESPETLRQSIDVRLSLRAAFGATGEIGRLDEHLHVASELAERLNDRPRLAAVNAARALTFNLLGHLDRTIETGGRARNIARALGDRRIEVASTLYVGQAYTWLGECQLALQLLRPPPADLLGELRHARIGTTGISSVLWLGLLCATQAYLGEFDDALAAGAQAQQIAAEANRPYDVAIADWYQGFAHGHRGDLDAASALLDRSYAVCRDGRIHLLIPIVSTSLGYVYALQGRLEQAAALLETALAQWRRTGMQYGVAWVSTHLGLVRLLAGDAQAAAELGETALALARKGKYRAAQTAALRLLGAAEAQRPSPDFERARARLTESLAAAEQAGLRPDIAHARLALGELALSAGAPAEAEVSLGEAATLYRALGMSFWRERALAAAGRSRYASAAG